MKKSFVLIISLLMIFSCGPTQTKESSTEESESAAAESEDTARSVFFVSPSNGDTVSTTFIVEMGVEGMQIEPAGEVNEGFGHHHVLINQTGWPEGEIIPPSDTTIHYGQGETQAELTLEPGEYTIALQFADGVHRSFGKEMAATIRILVE